MRKLRGIQPGVRENQRVRVRRRETRQRDKERQKESEYLRGIQPDQLGHVGVTTTGCRVPGVREKTRDRESRRDMEKQR